MQPVTVTTMYTAEFVSDRRVSRCLSCWVSSHWVTIFPLKPSFKLGFKRNFSLKPN